MNYQTEQMQAKRQYDADYGRNDRLGAIPTTGGLTDSVPGERRAVPHAIITLEKDLYALGEVVNILNNRLGPVSRPECPATNEEQTKQIMPDVQIANAIEQATKMLRAQLRILNDMIQRLEV